MKTGGLRWSTRRTPSAYDLPARRDPGRADAESLSRLAEALHRREHPSVEGDPGQRGKLRPFSRRAAHSSGTVEARRPRRSTRAPNASAPRLYVDSLNEMFDAQTTRVAALGNRVPNAVLVLEIRSGHGCVGAACRLPVDGRAGRDHGSPGIRPRDVASARHLRSRRPDGGFITVPDTALVNVRLMMVPAPAATGPKEPKVSP